MRVLVTGGSGRLGQPLIQALVARGDSVFALTRSDAAAQTVRALGAESVPGDLSKGAPSLPQVDQVFHLAGGVRGKGRETPDVLNRQGTEALISGLGAFDGKVVFASTGAVYGDRSNLWIEEDFPPTPDTRYGRSKVAAEQALMDAGLDVCLVRLAAVYGPGLTFAQVDRMREGKAWLPGEGRNHIPTIHLDDAIAGLIFAAERGPSRAPLHLADRTQPTLGDFMKAVHQHVGGKPVRFWSTYVPSYVQTWIAQQNERIQSRTGGRPRLTPDALKLWRASVRLRTELLAEAGFEWRYPDPAEGIRASWSKATSNTP